MPQLRYFRERIDEDDHPQVRENFRSARMEVSFRDYIASAVTNSVILFVVLSGIFFFAFSFLLKQPLLYSIPLSIGAGGITGFVIYRLFLYYPRLKAINREKEIEDRLHHAVAYMLALSKGGYKPIQIFEMLSSETEDYGEIAREAGAVYRNANFLGYSPSKSIQEVAESTPSERFRDFLNSFASVVETGSDITEFLSRRVERYYTEAEDLQEEDLESLGILSEVYVVALGLGPLLLVIMLILFGMMGNFYVNLLYLLVYLGIPLGTLLFAVVLDMQTRTSVGGRISPSETEGRISDLGSKGTGGRNWSDRLSKAPSKIFLESPVRILYITLPVAAGIALPLLYFGYLSLTSTAVFSILMAATPLSAFYEKERRTRERKLESTPDFLGSLSSALSSGLSPAKAIKSIPSERMGGLSSEIKKAKADMEWGSSVGEALERMTVRVRSSILRRIIRLVRRSTEVVADLTGILDVLERDISLERSMKDERQRTTFIYMLIVYITFGVFLLTAYSVSTALLPLIPQIQGTAQPGFGGVGVGVIEPATVKTIFFHASLIQGFSTGLLAGKLKDGEVLSGLKHSIIMVIVAWLVFTLLVL